MFINNDILSYFALTKTTLVATEQADLSVSETDDLGFSHTTFP